MIVDNSDFLFGFAGFLSTLHGAVYLLQLIQCPDAHCADATLAVLTRAPSLDDHQSVHVIANNTDC